MDGPLGITLGALEVLPTNTRGGYIDIVTVGQAAGLGAGLSRRPMAPLRPQPIMEGLPYDEYGKVHPSGHAPHKPTVQIRTWIEDRGLTPIGTRPYPLNRSVAPLAVTAPDSSHDVGPRLFWGGGINRRSGQRCREARACACPA